MGVSAPPAATGRASQGPILPREHGAWAMLLIPLVVSLAVAGRWGLEGPLFLGTCLALYVSRQPLTMLVRDLKHPAGQEWGRPLLWLIVYAVLALAFGLPLLYFYERWLLLPWAAIFLAFTAAHFYLRKLHLDRTIPGELVTIAGLALTAPGAYYVAKGLEPTAIYLWALTTLYSGSSVFYVRLKMRQRSLRRPAKDLRARLNLGRANIVYQGFLVLVLALAAISGQVPLLVPLAFIPLLAKVGDGILRGSSQVNIKRIGWTEVAHSVAFTFLLVGTYLVGPRA
ncbi:MAG: YwiC-like family protein [Dehalococcoidia bacterium]|nr:YwiC-like family protein [Dehalococcoidia bacterium]